MGMTLNEVSASLQESTKKIQVIYAFNGVGKTRLSRAFKNLVTPKTADDQEDDSGIKILYYNAFTEDLFYWDNDSDRKLIIRPNSFTDWVLKEEGQANNIITSFQNFTSEKLTPRFSDDFRSVSFSIEGGNNERIENIKISRGEESCFVWCVFFALIKDVIEVLGTAEPEDRSTRVFDDLKYIFIDDPVSSLDENHLIELAVNIAALAKRAPADLRFIITTHNPLFFNVLCCEFNNDDPSYKYARNKYEKKRLDKTADGSYIIKAQKKESPFSYHISLLTELEKAIESDSLRKYHYNFLRNILEKTATFLGYPTWTKLLPEDDRLAYYNRIINLSSHGRHSGEEVPVLESGDKRVLEFLVRRLKNDLKFNPDTIDKEDDH